METKERENMNTSLIRENIGEGVEHLKMKFVGKKYHTQPTSTRTKRKQFLHEIQKLAVDVTFIQMTAKKGTNKNVEREVSVMYK